MAGTLSVPFTKLHIWKKRWCVLSDRNFTVFKDEAAEQMSAVPLSRIEISSYLEVRTHTHPSHATPTCCMRVPITFHERGVLVGGAMGVMFAPCSPLTLLCFSFESLVVSCSHAVPVTHNLTGCCNTRVPQVQRAPGATDQKLREFVIRAGDATYLFLADTLEDKEAWVSAVGGKVHSHRIPLHQVSP